MCWTLTKIGENLVWKFKIKSIKINKIFIMKSSCFWHHQHTHTKYQRITEKKMRRKRIVKERNNKKWSPLLHARKRKKIHTADVKIGHVHYVFNFHYFIALHQWENEINFIRFFECNLKVGRRWIFVSLICPWTIDYLSYLGRQPYSTTK